MMHVCSVCGKHSYCAIIMWIHYYITHHLGRLSEQTYLKAYHVFLCFVKLLERMVVASEYLEESERTEWSGFSAFDASHHIRPCYLSSKIYSCDIITIQERSRRPCLLRH